jgi:ribosome-binding protein aMBF1 (putative translation factor)
MLKKLILFRKKCDLCGSREDVKTTKLTVPKELVLDLCKKCRNAKRLNNNGKG